MLRHRTGSGHETGRGIGRGLNGKKGLIAKVLHLACEDRSPNRDWELSAGELNRWEMEAGRLLDIQTAVPLRGAAVFN